MTSKKILAIANCRVSSDEQLENNSLKRQRDSVTEAAERLGATIPVDGWWSGSVSSKRGKNIDRKDIHQMLDYCKHHKEVKYLIVDEPDRFMRSVDEAFYIEMQFKLIGVRVWYASDDDLNSDNMQAKLMKFMKYFVAEGSNEERTHKSISGHSTALKEGRYTFHPKPAYMRGTQVGIPEVHPERGPALRDVLIRMCEHVVEPTEGLIELNKSDYTLDRAPLKMDKFRKIATDPFYAGIVEINQQVRVRNERGLHEPLITLEQHYELVRIFADKKKNQTGPRKNGNPEYPMNTITLHDTCLELKNKGKFVGYKHSNGKNPNLIYKKYRCRSCGFYLSRDELHSKVAQLFTDNPITIEGIRSISEALDFVWDRKNAQAKQDSARIRQQITSLSQDIESRAMAAIEPSNIAIKPEILSNIEKMKFQITELEEQLVALNEKTDTDKQRFLDFAFNFVIRMQESFFSLSPEDAKKCKQILFPGGFYMDADKNVYTPEISPLIRLAANKKDAEASDFNRMVRVKRL